MARLKGHDRMAQQGRSNNYINVMSDSQLVLWQVNVKFCLKRMRLILKEARNLQGRGPDVIAVQDPPLAVPWLSCGPFVVNCRADRPLSETDNPADHKGEKDFKPVPIAKVCFYVHKTIPQDRWNVTYHEGRNKDYSATLHLSTLQGQYSIHNMYNQLKQADMQDFVDVATTSKCDIVVGDFNLHHRDWGGDLFKRSQNCSDANTLRDGMMASDMQCITTPGTVTYTRGTRQDTATSCIDLTFVSRAIAPNVLGCNVHHIPSLSPSDHRPVQTVLNIELVRDETIYYCWRRIDKETYLRAVATALTGIECGELATREQIDAFATAIRDAIMPAVHSHVPARPICAPKSSKSTAQRQSDDGGMIKSQAQLRRARHQLKKMELRERRQQQLVGPPQPQRQGDDEKQGPTSWRNHVSAVSKTNPGVFKISSVAKRICQPKGQGRIPPLSHGGLTYSTEAEKGECLRHSMWPETSDGDAAPSLPHPTKPAEGSAYHELWADQTLTEGELSRAIQALPTGKAAGDDGMANEAIKMARVQLVPHLTSLFQACLSLSHHPAIFKHAVTIILPKADKETYSEPKSWRPIALLPALGKLLEKVVAERLKMLALTRKLLPRSQYGAPGKSTSHAVQDILGTVYAAWSRRKKRILCKIRGLKLQRATILSLDIAGAYDNIARTKLLEILIQKNLPWWIVLFIHSFLSDRSTVLKMPGSTTESFFINIGIPQGSPLSPILFLFFAAPILDKITQNHRGVTVHAYAYVDDLYLVAVSNEYRINCDGLKTCHDNILEWANPAGVTFAPHKYKIMHFKDPRCREDNCPLLPDIPGLQNPEECLKTELKILGVIVDHQLKWNAHLSHIESKVRKQTKYLRRILGSTWGLSLGAARRIYLAKIRPIISYACGAWFVYSRDQKLNWRLSSDNLTRLDRLQYDCLKQISGALGKCGKRVVEKELNIESIHVFLCRIALSHRAKSLEVRATSPFVDRIYVSGKKLAPKTSPYELLNKEARELCLRSRQRLQKNLANNPKGDANMLKSKWLDPAARKKAITKQAKQDAQEISAEIWDEYRRDRAVRHHQGQRPRALHHRPAALAEGWGPESFRYYKNLTRAQSTMLLHCRTEFIGLNYYLSNVNLAPSAACSCGHAKQTVFHMFKHCKNLSAARSRLTEELQHTDFKALMTRDGAVVADWAIAFFNLDQFVWPRQHSRFLTSEAETPILGRMTVPFVEGTTVFKQYKPSLKDTIPHRGI